MNGAGDLEISALIVPNGRVTIVRLMIVNTASLSKTTDICLECSRRNVKKIFRENPEVKQAFRETIEELKKPENVEKMAKNTANFMNAIQKLRRI